MWKSLTCKSLNSTDGMSPLAFQLHDAGLLDAMRTIADIEIIILIEMFTLPAVVPSVRFDFSDICNHRKQDRGGKTSQQVSYPTKGTPSRT